MTFPSIDDVEKETRTLLHLRHFLPHERRSRAIRDIAHVDDVARMDWAKRNPSTDCANETMGLRALNPSCGSGRCFRAPHQHCIWSTPSNCNDMHYILYY